MVQPKNKEPLMEFMRREAKEHEARNPVIGHKWVVEEVTAAYNTGGYYDQDIPEKRVVVANDFKTEAEAKAWMDKHIADKGNYLEAVKYNLRQYNPKPYTRWERVWRPRGQGS
jgi:hypothetical protein